MSQNTDDCNLYNKEFHDELMSAVVSNPKIEFSADGSSNDDIIALGRKNCKDFIHFFNYGPNGLSILEGNRDNHWVTTPNPEENSFTIMFTHHSVRLTKFQIHTGNKKFEKLVPNQFVLFGFNSRVKRWDAISDFQGQSLNADALYSFDVREDNQKIFYRIFRFITLSGQIALAYIKLYGDVMAETDNPPDDAATDGNTLVNYQKKPYFVCLKQEKFTEGLFKTATKIFGPELECFVKVTCKADESSRFYDIWGSRNKSFRSIKSDKPIFICFYFPYHEVFISGYQIQPSQKNSIRSWCIIGCENNDDEGLILDHQDNCSLENEKSFYSWKTKETYNDKPFRIIRFVGLDGVFSFHCLDFLGKAKPCPSKVLTDKDMFGSFTFSHTIQEWNHGK